MVHAVGRLQEAQEQDAKLGKGTITIKTKGAHKETIHLSGTGKKYVAHRHGTIKISAGGPREGRETRDHLQQDASAEDQKEEVTPS